MKALRAGGERGSATVELALVLPVIVALLLAIVWAALAGAAQMSVTEAARAAARDIAIGESDAAARATAARVCGCAAATAITTGPWAQVTVTATSPALTWIPGVRIAASFAVPREEGR